MLHSIIMNCYKHYDYVTSLSKYRLWNDIKQTFLNNQNLSCVKYMCLRIFHSDRSNTSKAVRSLYSAMYMHNRFVIFRLMARGTSLQS